MRVRRTAAICAHRFNTLDLQSQLAFTTKPLALLSTTEVSFENDAIERTKPMFLLYNSYYYLSEV